MKSRLKNYPFSNMPTVACALRGHVYGSQDVISECVSCVLVEIADSNAVMKLFIYGGNISGFTPYFFVQSYAINLHGPRMPAEVTLLALYS